MRLLLLAACLLVPLAAAKDTTDGGWDVDGSVTTPSSGCPDCVGATVSADEEPPEYCSDCTTHHIQLGASHDGAGTHVDAEVCRGGFFYICVVDEHHTV